MKRSSMRALALAALLASFRLAYADGCTTQSQMKPEQRTALSQAALDLAHIVQTGNVEEVRSRTIPQYAKDFGGIQYAVASASPHLKDTVFTVETLWLLDASNLKQVSDGTPQDGQFFCKLSGSPSDVSFLIPSLPAGRYALAVVNAVSLKPWQIAMLFQDVAGSWKLAGIFPRPTVAGGHNGLWYWLQARDLAGKGQRWNAWLYYAEAESLLKPVDFVSSSHLDRLRDEASKVTPPALSQGIGQDKPLVVRASNGTEYRFTGISTDDSLAADRIDLSLHLKADPVADPAAARQRNIAAARAFLAAYPELRQPFHGVWVVAESPGQNPFATEHPIADLL